MKDPERLLSGGASEFERLVLRAARLEQPSATHRRRMRRALLLAEFGFLATGLKAAASVANQLVAVAIIAGSLAGNSSSSTSVWDAAKVTTETGALAVKPQAKVATEASPGASPTGEVAPVPAEERAVDAVDTAATKTLSRAGNPNKAGDLRGEILLLDQARTEMRSGRASQALATLGRYFARYSRGAFRQEATVLRIEALAISGNQRRATAEARAFMVRNPKSPHIDKLQRLTGATSGAPTK